MQCILVYERTLYSLVKTVLGHTKFTQINRDYVSDILTVQQRGMHQYKEYFPVSNYEL